MDRNGDEVDKALIALGRAKVPEGLEARVVSGLQRQALDAEAARSAMVWWRGAACGAVVATLVVGCAMGLGHFALGSAERNARGAAPVSMPVGVPMNGSGQVPCASPAVVRMHKSDASPRFAVVSTAKPLRAAFIGAEAPLTDEERGLVRLVRIGGATQLETLNPEMRAKVEADDAAEFDRFFAPPAAPSTKEGNE